MKLYRGDCLCNTGTLPGRYRLDGIRSKTFGIGDPAYIKREGLIAAIRKHVRPDRSIPEELHYYNTTDFISFSEDRDRALYWLSERGKLTLTSNAENFRETRYLFTIEIDLAAAINFGDGIYLYRYPCAPSLKEANAPDMMSMLAAQAVRAAGCDICGNGTTTHSMVLVNSEQYLSSYNADRSLDGAIQFAHNDREWLILPADPMSPGFFHARIPRSPIWKTELFNDGTTRDTQHHAELGMIGDDNGNII